MSCPDHHDPAPGRWQVAAWNQELVTCTCRRTKAGGEERWPSGRRRSPAKRVGGLELPRGFKSLPLRPTTWHLSVAAGRRPLG